MEETYTVLYYKRKNKVHKSKGVSKKDGILTTDKKSLIVSLMDDGNQVFRGIHREIASKTSLQVDDIIVLGSYEVEILSHEDSAAAGTSTKPQTKQPLQRKIAPKTSFFRGPLHPKASRPLTAAAAAAAASPSTTHRSSVATKRILYRPPQPIKATPNYESSSSSSSSSSSDEESSKFERKLEKENLLTARASAKRPPPVSSSTTTRLPPFKKHIRTIVPSIKNSNGLTKPPQKPLGIRPFTKTPPHPSSGDFLGAVGKINLPHSIKSVLKPHQVEGVTFLWNCLTGNNKANIVSPHVPNHQVFKGAILADEMGLGKTLMTIATICALFRQNRSSKFVVVCPSSLVVNWAKECNKWLGKASQPKRVVVQKGGNTEGVHQIKAFATTALGQVIIISYDLFRMNAPLFQQFRSALLIMDEAHRLKNTAGSLTLTALESLPCDARLCITATPVQNATQDLFSICNFVNPGLLGDLTTFRKEYERPIAASNNKSCSSEQRRRGMAQSRILEEITKTFMLRRLQKDVLKTMLPPRTEVLLFCRPTAKQCKLYKEFTRRPSADPLSTLTRLRKLCSHPAMAVEDTTTSSSSSSSTTVLDPSLDATNVEFSGKVSFLDSLLANIRVEAIQDKIVIVSNFTSTLTMIENSILKPRGLTFIRLDGTTELSNRQGIVDTFNQTSSERYFCFLLSSKAGGCGLNLIGANRLIMFDPDWNPASDIQAMARIYRQGQEKPCFIYRLFTSGTVEEVICQRQIQKGNLATLTVDGGPKSKGSATSFNSEDLKECFTLKEDCDCDTKLKIGKKWPEYDGPGSIERQGCTDAPLLAIANDETTPLAFVHVVTQEETQNIESSEIKIGMSPKYESETSEEELQLNDEESADEVKVDDEESSDDEFEF